MTGKCWDSIELLTDETDITRFCCGVPEIDLWFQGYALEAQDESGCAVYVALRADGSVVGFIAEAVSKARELAKAVGCRLMYVNALNDGLAAWYRRQGFLSLPSKPNSLVLDLRAK